MRVFSPHCRTEIELPLSTESNHQSSMVEPRPSEKIRFVDLNRDRLIRTPLHTSYMRMKNLWLPRTVLEADFLVSMPKIKTHHWAGVTLGMKNMFGVVPGARYGWPKNILHWKGIQESILDLCATAPVHFVIADGIVAMEGNGPLNGTPRLLGKIVLADDPVAADATCARLMGFEPSRIVHIREGSRFLGNAAPSLIDQVGETVNAPTTPFQVVPEFRYLRATGGVAVTVAVRCSTSPTFQAFASDPLCAQDFCKLLDNCELPKDGWGERR